MANDHDITDPFANETWRPVCGFERDYSVSDLGRVRRETRAPYARTFVGKILRGRRDDVGYRNVLLCGGGKRVCRRVHKLVMEAFVGPCPNGWQVNHINFDRLDNRLCNLEYLTRQANMAHSKAAGRLGNPNPPRGDKVWTHRHPERVRGESNGFARINEEIVRTIRAEKAAGASLSALMARFGLAKSHLSRIVRRESWAHVT